MADNVNITPGTGNVVAADEVTDGALGTVKVQYIKLMDGTIDSTNKAIIDSSGNVQVNINNFPASQPVSIASMPSTPVTGPLTDTQLRATPVPISGTVTSTPSGTQNVAVTSTVSTPVTGTFFQTTQPVSLAVAPTTTVVQPTGTNLHVVVDSAPSTTVTGTVAVSNFPATQPVSGSVSVSNFPATQPVSGTVAATQSGTWTVQPGNTANTIAWKVDGSGVTQPVSGTVTGNQGTPAATANRWPVQLTDGTDLALVSAAGALQVDGSGVTQPVSGTITANQGTSPWVENVSQFGGSPIVTGVGLSGSGIPRVTVSTDSQVQIAPATLCVSTTAATGVAVTATLPAVAGQFHYITSIAITKYFTVANAASATPLLVTTTNLPGSLTFTFGQPLGTVGTTDVRIDNFGFPLKSIVANTNTTIVCPATTGIIWRVNVFYNAAA